MKNRTYTDSVDPHQGNGKIDLPKPYAPADTWHFIKGLAGNTHPGAVLPFGKYSVLGYSGGYPCGCGTNRVNCGEPIGDISSVPQFIGLSHFHQSGTGAIGVYYNYALTHPYDGTVPTFSPVPLTGEEAHPGYYRAETDCAVCEATVSTFTAVHRYTFRHPGEEHRIAVDFANDGLYPAPRLRGEASGAVSVREDGCLCAEMLLSGIRLYFVIRCEGGRIAGLFRGTELSDAASLTLRTPASDVRFGGIFAVSDTCVLRAAVSAVSAEHARALLDTETRSFDAIRSAATSRWEQALSRIEIETDDARERRIFYSNLYHTLVKPCDLSGEAFLFADKDQPFVTDIATMWDIYKTQLPLLFTLYPEISEKLLHTLQRFGTEYGYFPHCLLLSGNTGIESKQARMLAEYAICDAFYRGIRADYPALIELSRKDGARFADFHDDSGSGCRTASHTLDMAEAYTSLSHLAEALGDTAAARQFAAYGKKFVLAFGKDGMMRPDSDYYEGNRCNYSFRPVWDRETRFSLAGGKETLIREARRFFGFTDGTDFTSRFEGFNNETDMEAPLFLHELRLDKELCQVVRAGLDCMFSDGPGGIPGNADSGGLTACYLWMALGLFPVSGQDRMILIMPRYRRAVLHLPAADLIIERRGDGRYPASVTFNGIPCPASEIPASVLQKGGTLVFTTE